MRHRSQPTFTPCRDAIARVSPTIHSYPAGGPLNGRIPILRRTFAVPTQHLGRFILGFRYEIRG